MKVKYLVQITDPKTHIVDVKLELSEITKFPLTVFMPSWSPGSYLMREYSKNIRTFKATGDSGEYVFFEQKDKGAWVIDPSIEPNKEFNSITIDYQVYCHELTVRTSHVDESHAFLHGPSYLMGVEGESFSPIIEFKFPALWSKIHTAMPELNDSLNEFVFCPESYDVLLDTPVEIGCHESDGFMHDNKEHHLIFYGESYPHKEKLKDDIKTIVETVSKHFSSIPYDKYYFITHFKRNLYGGLEHLNSTALHYDGRKLSSRKDYIMWLALVAHEYFHTWNVKRIRPKELGPFDYRNENYTRMHWLTEGLTSFMDELFVYRSGLCTLEEYLEMQKDNLNRYFSIPGKKFHSLEDSSFNAWIKLYRPDENSLNSSISYYLKGGLVFSALHFELVKKGKNINDLLSLLWERYLANPKEGMEAQEVYEMVQELGDKDLLSKFTTMLSTTEDIDFETYYKQIGLEFVWDETSRVDLGARLRFEGDRILVDSIILDKAAYNGGLNAGDEIIAVNNMRFLKSDLDEINKLLVIGHKYKFTVARLGTLIDLEILIEKEEKKLLEIKIVDKELSQKVFK